MSNILIGGLVIALLVGIICYMVFRDNSTKDPRKGFMIGFGAVMLAVLAIFLAKRKNNS